MMLYTIRLYMWKIKNKQSTDKGDNAKIIVNLEEV